MTALPRPSDDLDVTRRILAAIRRPWRVPEDVNVLTLRPYPVTALDELVAFVNGVERPVAEYPPEPSRTRPAGMLRTPPAVVPVRPVARKPKPVRRRGLFGLVERLQITFQTRADGLRRHLAEGGAGSRRGSWEGAR
jgi:hypothetical protein